MILFDRKRFDNSSESIVASATGVHRVLTLLEIFCIEPLVLQNYQAFVAEFQNDFTQFIFGKRDDATTNKYFFCLVSLTVEFSVLPVSIFEMMSGIAPKTGEEGAAPGSQAMVDEFWKKYHEFAAGGTLVEYQKLYFKLVEKVVRLTNASKYAEQMQKMDVKPAEFRSWVLGTIPDLCWASNPDIKELSKNILLLVQILGNSFVSLDHLLGDKAGLAEVLEIHKEELAKKQ